MVLFRARIFLAVLMAVALVVSLLASAGHVSAHARLAVSLHGQAAETGTNADQAAVCPGEATSHQTHNHGPLSVPESGGGKADAVCPAISHCQIISIAHEHARFLPFVMPAVLAVGPVPVLCGIGGPPETPPPRIDA